MSDNIIPLPVIRVEREDFVSVPASMLRQLHDKLEEFPDWSEVGTDTWSLYHQIETFIYPDPEIDE